MWISLNLRRLDQTLVWGDTLPSQWFREGPTWFFFKKNILTIFKKFLGSEKSEIIKLKVYALKFVLSSWKYAFRPPLPSARWNPLLTISSWIYRLGFCEKPQIVSHMFSTLYRKCYPNFAGKCALPVFRSFRFITKETQNLHVYACHVLFHTDYTISIYKYS